MNELKVVKSLPLESNKALFAAGKDRVMIVYPDTKRIERWSLHTYEKELGQRFLMRTLLQLPWEVLPTIDLPWRIL